MAFETEYGQAILVADIVNVKEIARRLGVSVQTVYNWKRDPMAGFPAPFPGTNAYDYYQVYGWFDVWRQLNPRHYPQEDT
jgi:hypothetical protein